MPLYPIPDEVAHPLDEDFYKKFGITRNGFLPSKKPLRHLPNKYYEPWEVIVEDLAQLLQDGRFRAEIDRIPVLTTENLATEEQYRRAYVILTLFANGYMWGGAIASDVSRDQSIPS